MLARTSGIGTRKQLVKQPSGLQPSHKDQNPVFPDQGPSGVNGLHFSPQPEGITLLKDTDSRHPVRAMWQPHPRTDEVKRINLIWAHSTKPRNSLLRLSPKTSPKLPTFKALKAKDPAHTPHPGAHTHLSAPQLFPSRVNIYLTLRDPTGLTTGAAVRSGSSSQASP